MVPWKDDDVWKETISFLNVWYVSWKTRATEVCWLVYWAKVQFVEFGVVCLNIHSVPAADWGFSKRTLTFSRPPSGRTASFIWQTESITLELPVLQPQDSHIEVSGPRILRKGSEMRPSINSSFYTRPLLTEKTRRADYLCFRPPICTLWEYLFIASPQDRR